MRQHAQTHRRAICGALVLAGFALTGLAMTGTASATGQWSGDSVVVTDLPRSNMTMSQVRQRFGEPHQQRPAVGDPPIARWVYPGYTVYFEYDRVIVPVRHHRPLR